MNTLDRLYRTVLEGRRGEVRQLVERAIGEGVAPMAIIERTLRPAMNEVGERFSRAEFYLPDLILASEAMKNAVGALRPLLEQEDSIGKQETIVIGTVEGDLHDIGKNLVVATLEGAGYRVVDLGVNAVPLRYIDAVREHDPAVIGFSALLSTTMVNIPGTIRALQEAGLCDGRLLAAGGAPVTQRNADEWGVDIYAADAGTAMRVINEALAERRQAEAAG